MRFWIASESEWKSKTFLNPNERHQKTFHLYQTIFISFLKKIPANLTKKGNESFDDIVCYSEKNGFGSLCSFEKKFSSYKEFTIFFSGMEMKGASIILNLLFGADFVFSELLSFIIFVFL